MPRLLCRQLQLKRMLNGTDMTDSPSVLPQEVTKWIIDASESSQSVSPSVSQHGRAVAVNSQNAQQPYIATTRSGKHLTDPLAIAIAARAQWMFNDLLIGFRLFTPQQHNNTTTKNQRKRKKKKRKESRKNLEPIHLYRHYAYGKTFQATLINIYALHKRANTLGTMRPRT